jgi:hypothetical protein
MRKKNARSENVLLAEETTRLRKVARNAKGPVAEATMIMKKMIEIGRVVEGTRKTMRRIEIAAGGGATMTTITMFVNCPIPRWSMPRE